MNNFFDKQINATIHETISDEEVPTVETAEGTIADNSAHYTPQQIKSAVQELLKSGLLENERKPNLYQSAVSHQQAINNILEPLDLRLKTDDIRGLAFLIVADDMLSETGNEDEWSHPLIRRQRLTLEQTLLLGILRQHFVTHEQEAGLGATGATIDIDELKPQLLTYLGESGSDSRDEKRLRNLLEKLHAHGVVSEVNEKAQITIRPIITHLANPETLQLLLQHFKQLATDQNGHE